MSDLYQLIKKKLSTWFEKIPPPHSGEDTVGSARASLRVLFTPLLLVFPDLRAESIALSITKVSPC